MQLSPNEEVQPIYHFEYHMLRPMVYDDKGLVIAVHMPCCVSIHSCHTCEPSFIPIVFF